MPDRHNADDPVSPTPMPLLETERLLIRPYRMDDLEALHRILDIEINSVQNAGEALDLRRDYIEWSIRNYRQLALLYQPPYGDRAIARRSDGALIGACGLVPSFGPFGLFQSFSDVPAAARTFNLPQMGLYYALSTSVRGQGYATDAARALVDYGFTTLNLWRIVATTTYDNIASMAVMRRLGMQIERNPEREPQFAQVTGTLVNPAIRNHESSLSPEE